jgi:hypothetical protein
MSILRQSKCRAMAQAVSRLSLNAEARVRSVSVRVGFVMEKVALGQVSLRGLRFFLSVFFHRGAPCAYIT